MAAQALRAALGDDVDDAADRIRTPDRALRPAQHLDPLDVVGEQRREVELGAVDRVVDLDPVDDDQRVVCLRAAAAHLGPLAAYATPDDRARSEPRGVGKEWVRK